MRNSNAAETPLPRRARDARKARKWTQQEVAERAGVSLRTYQLFENGQSSPQRANFRAIVEVLGLEAETVAKVVPVNEPQQEPQWEPDIEAFLNMLGIYMEGLSDKERERFIMTETRKIFREMRSVNAQVEEMAGKIGAALADASPEEPRNLSDETAENA